MLQKKEEEEETFNNEIVRLIYFINEGNKV